MVLAHLEGAIFCNIHFTNALYHYNNKCLCPVSELQRKIDVLCDITKGTATTLLIPFPPFPLPHFLKVFDQQRTRPVMTQHNHRTVLLAFVAAPVWCECSQTQPFSRRRIIHARQLHWSPACVQVKTNRGFTKLSQSQRRTPLNDVFKNGQKTEREKKRSD